MALEGHGIAFLPHSAVKKELRARTLVPAMPTGFEGLEMTMEVRAYREKPGSKTGNKEAKSLAQALWVYLLAQNAARE